MLRQQPIHAQYSTQSKHFRAISVHHSRGVDWHVSVFFLSFLTYQPCIVRKRWGPAGWTKAHCSKQPIPTGSVSLKTSFSNWDVWGWVIQARGRLRVWQILISWSFEPTLQWLSSRSADGPQSTPHAQARSDRNDMFSGSIRLNSLVYSWPGCESSDPTVHEVSQRCTHIWVLRISTQYCES